MRLALLLLLLVAWFGLASPAPAIPAPEAYGRARFWWSAAQARAQLVRLRRIPLGAWALSLLEEGTGLRLERDLASWWGGVCQVGLVRVAEISPLNLLYRWQNGIPEREQLLDELRNLGAALDSYKLAHGQPPERWEQLVPEFLEAVPEREGVTFVLERAEGCWRIRTVLAPESSLASSGPAPTFSEQEGLEGEPPPRPVGLIWALDTSRPEETRRALKRLGRTWPALQASGQDRWTLSWDGWPTLHLALADGWLVASDEPTLLPGALTWLDLSRNPRYQAQRELLPAAEELFLFVDLHEALDHCPDLVPAARRQLASLQSLGITAWGVGRPTPAQIHARAFLAADPAVLTRFTEGQPAPPDRLLPRLPWDFSELLVVDLALVYRVLERVADLEPAVGVWLTAGIAQAEKALGQPLPTDLLRQGPMALLLTYERGDVLAAIFRVFDDFRSALGQADRPSRGGAPGEAEPSPSPGPEPVQEALSELPFMAALQVPRGPLQDSLYAGLLRALGAHPRSYRAVDIRVETSAEGRLAVARQGELLLLAGGGSGRLLDRVLETSAGQRPSLLALETCQRFQEGLQGRVILFTHAKVDWLYSLAKGLILMLGSDFRREAVAMGRWRDVYGALTLEEGGLRLTGSLFSSDQEPGP